MVLADHPSSEMYGECRALLAMFGLPFLVAPEEAEAQCAWLDAAGLVDGVVTDDNDVFLFGGRHVFRCAARRRPAARARGARPYPDAPIRALGVFLYQNPSVPYPNARAGTCSLRSSTWRSSARRT